VLDRDSPAVICIPRRPTLQNKNNLYHQANLDFGSAAEKIPAQLNHFDDLPVITTLAFLPHLILMAMAQSIANRAKQASNAQLS
jgi:hypothetical protein